MGSPLEFLVVFAVLWLVTAPLLTFVHELGHAVAALALTPGPVTLHLGTEPPQVSWRLGRLAVRFRQPSVWTGFCTYEGGDLAGRRQVWFSLAGPLASLLAAVLFALLTYLPGGLPAPLPTLFFWGFVGALFQFVLTALPMRYPAWMGAYAGCESDGARVRSVLRGEAATGRP